MLRMRQTLLTVGANVVVEAVALVMTLDWFTDATISTGSLCTLVLAVVNVQSGEDITHQGELSTVDDRLLDAPTEHLCGLYVLVNVTQTGHSAHVQVQWQRELSEGSQ